MTFDYMPREIEAAAEAVRSSKTGGASIKPRDLLLAALPDIGKAMCQAADLHSGWHIDEIDSHIVTRGASQDELKNKIINLEEGDKWFREYGCTICDIGPDGYELTDCTDSISGASVVYGHDECLGKARAVRAGSFHTHPYGFPLPSYPDVMNTFIGNMRMNFIGGCVDGRKVLVGYAPRPESYIKWEMRQKIDPYEAFKRANVDKFIYFLYRPPGSTSIEEVVVKEFAAYDKDEKMDRFVMGLEYLSGIFDVIVHWC